MGKARKLTCLPPSEVTKEVDLEPEGSLTIGNSPFCFNATGSDRIVTMWHAVAMYPEKKKYMLASRDLLLKDRNFKCFFYP